MLITSQTNFVLCLVFVRNWAFFQSSCTNLPSTQAITMSSFHSTSLWAFGVWILAAWIGVLYNNIALSCNFLVTYDAKCLHECVPKLQTFGGQYLEIKYATKDLYPEYKKNPQNWKKLKTYNLVFLIGKIAQCIFQQSWHMDDVK